MYDGCLLDEWCIWHGNASLWYQPAFMLPVPSAVSGSTCPVSCWPHFKCCRHRNCLLGEHFAALWAAVLTSLLLSPLTGIEAISHSDCLQARMLLRKIKSKQASAGPSSSGAPHAHQNGFAAGANGPGVRQRPTAAQEAAARDPSATPEQRQLVLPPTSHCIHAC